MNGMRGWLLLGVLVSAPVGVVAEGAGSWWQRTQQGVGEVWNGVAGNGTAQPPVEPVQNLQEVPADQFFPEVWEQMLPRLEEALQLTDEQPQLPESAWIGRDRQDAAAEVDQLLDEAIEILGISGAAEFRQQIRALEQRIAELRQEIATNRQLRVTAPREALLQTTREGYDKEIEAAQQEIRELEVQLMQLRRRFAARLRESGLEVSELQLEFLLSTVVGDDIVRIGVAFENIKQITGQLEKLVEQSQEELAAARRYYGMYTVLLRVLDQMYLHLGQEIDGRYLPEIDRISERTEQLAVETRGLLESMPDREPALRQNQEAQQLTLRAAGLYHQYLQQQREEVLQAKARLEQEIRIARNTYETVKVSGELVSLVRTSHNLLETLKRMQVPKLRGFENLEMKREFERLTRQLKENRPDGG